ncbi:SGNH/GDSL hydrolase family protein [Planomicrobium sp. YIM 101495]|uniref:SGNH/GDSL hydrolase family protein n=1 Tax=Planomicrobium sp. YIM 101495 TaxID=2665160 RepID=UPI00351A72F6
MKKLILMVVAAVSLSGVAAPVSAELKTPAAYVALGDSLAAGQTPDNAIDTGYSDLIAQELVRHQRVVFYTKDLAFPGFTTADVLERVRSAEAQEVLKQANIITISAGANDLLQLVQSNPDQGSLAFDQIQADFAMNKARQNMEKTLAELTDRAPNADVYVMGYYFAYPHARDSQKAGVGQQLDRLNAILKRTAEQADAVFIPVDAAFGDGATDKVPNAADVHPNILGYQAMANAFLASYAPRWKVEQYELPKPAPQSFEQIMAQQEAASATAPQSTTTDPDASVRKPSEDVKMDYLAIKGPILYI